MWRWSIYHEANRLTKLPDNLIWVFPHVCTYISQLSILIEEYLWAVAVVWDDSISKYSSLLGIDDGGNWLYTTGKMQIVVELQVLYCDILLFSQCDFTEPRIDLGVERLFRATYLVRTQLIKYDWNSTYHRGCLSLNSRQVFSGCQVHIPSGQRRST